MDTIERFEKLSTYGVVKTCKLVHDDIALIVVTKDFSENAIKTFEFLKVCTECFPHHSILDTCVTEPHFALVVLKTKSNLGSAS